MGTEVSPHMGRGSLSPRRDCSLADFRATGSRRPGLILPPSGFPRHLWASAACRTVGGRGVSPLLDPGPGRGCPGRPHSAPPQGPEGTGPLNAGFLWKKPGSRCDGGPAPTGTPAPVGVFPGLTSEAFPVLVLFAPDLPPEVAQGTEPRTLPFPAPWDAGLRGQMKVLALSSSPVAPGGREQEEAVRNLLEWKVQVESTVRARGLGSSTGVPRPTASRPRVLSSVPSPRQLTPSPAARRSARCRAAQGPTTGEGARGRGRF